MKKPRQAVRPRHRPTARPASATVRGPSASLSPTLLRELRLLADSLRTAALLTQDVTAGSLVVLEGPEAGLREQAAFILAQRLGKPLYRVSLGELVGGYIAETEKNLDRVMAEAERAEGILVIDEAEALFGRAPEENTSRDGLHTRELNNLLGRLRQNSSISILSASRIRKIDPSVLDAVRAFLRLSGKDS